jgi:hypothetical protein
MAGSFGSGWSANEVGTGLFSINATEARQANVLVIILLACCQQLTDLSLYKLFGYLCLGMKS